MVIIPISSNFEAKFIKRYLIEPRPGTRFLSHISTGAVESLRERKPVFSVLQLFKYSKSFRHNLQSFTCLLALFTYIYRRLSTHLDSLKKTVSTLPNTLATRIFARVEIGN